VLSAFFDIYIHLKLCSCYTLCWDVAHTGTDVCVVDTYNNHNIAKMSNAVQLVKVL